MKHNAQENNMLLLINKNLWLGSYEELKETILQEVNLDFYYLLLLDNKLLFLTPFNSKELLQNNDFEMSKIIGFSEIFFTDKEPSRLILLNNLKKNEAEPEFEAKTIDLEKFETFIHQIFDQIIVLYTEIESIEHNINIHIIKNLITTTMLITLKKYSTITTQLNEINKTNNKNIAALFVQLLETNFRTQSNLKFYIEKLETTENILKNECKKSLGMPPKEIMQKKVITEAKRLLLNQSNTIQQISYDLGYNDPSNFNKFFLKRTGITPNEFRKQSANDIIASRFLP